MVKFLTFLPKALRLIGFAALAMSLSGCYLFNFFKRGNDSGDDSDSGIVGGSIGEHAGGVDEAALALVHGTAAVAAPAAIRPDPDLFVRRLLRQYRPEGATIARQIGQVEQFRLLLGGATEDFSKNAQDSYDATSLLAVFKVAEEVCRGLVAPNQWEHEGWTTILPYPATDEQANIAWLSQRLIGMPSARIDPAVATRLAAIMAAEEPFITENWWAYDNAYAKYIPVCATLALDAEALYL